MTKKTLIIAEKPSVATDLSRVLGKLPEFGKFEKKKDYFESETGIVASAVGHLVELKMPEGENGKKLPWGMKHLPILPTTFELQPIERNESRYKLLLRLLKRKDVDVVVNACDAGREGELIFRYLLRLADLNKDMVLKRMWMQSMTDNSIIDAWNNLRSDEEMQPLADAAMCRSESDWLIGLNGTRALTAYNSRNGGFNMTTAGRVQTPTLVILAEREWEIRAFKAETYYEVHATFGVDAGQYLGRWTDLEFKRPGDDKFNRRKAERIWDRELAEGIVARCEGQVGIVEEVKKPKTSSAPPLFDLTTLQRECSGKHGFSATRTLQLAQQLYDRYKLTTYPRTDSKYLPEDYVQTVRDTISGFASATPNASFGQDYVDFSRWITSNDRVQPDKKIFDTKKVSDHFAIIPTGKIPPPKLDEAAKKVYDIIVKRFLAKFYPAAQYEDTTRTTRIGQDAFLTKGSILVTAGWLEVYGKKPGVASEKGELCAAQDGEPAQTVEIESKEDKTKPPPRYNDSTLLSAMETAGKRVENEELRDAMSERGLGTPATRAQTIETLIRTKYIFRHDVNRREFVCSNKGLALVKLLREIGIEALGSPEMTGEWEHKLKEMEQGGWQRSAFMEEIQDLTKKIVKQTCDFTEEIVNRVFPDIEATCPECGNTEIRQTDGLFACKNPECDFRIKKHNASHELTEQEARDLINNKLVGPIEDFKSRYGQPFKAELLLVKEKKKWKIEFKYEGDEEREKELQNLTDEQVICMAPLLDDSTEMVKVFETDRAYLAPEIGKSKKNPRGTRMGKTLCQRDITQAEAISIFTNGQSELLEGFISKKGRKFRAHLKIDREEGAVKFDFPERKKASDKDGDGDEAAGGKKKKAAKGTKKAAKKKTTKKKSAKKKAAKKAAKKKTVKAAEEPADTEG